MIRKLAFVLGILFSVHANAGWYAGGGAGKQQLQYNVNGWVDDQLADPDVKPYIDALNEAGATQSRDIKTGGLAVKGFIGYSFTPRTAVELSYRKYSDMSVSVTEKLAGSGATSGGYDGHDGGVSATAQGSVTGAYSIRAHGVGLSIVQRVYDPIFVRLGAERVTAKTVGTVSGQYSYSYKGELDNETTSGSGADNQITSNRVKTYTKTAPVYGFGADFNVIKKTFVRVEYERVGTPSTGLSFYGVSVLYKF